MGFFIMCLKVAGKTRNYSCMYLVYRLFLKYIYLEKTLFDLPKK